jgi:transcriptional regulator with XRE-family HTH domain
LKDGGHVIGSALKRIREDRRLTQDDVAKMLGVTRQAVCMWEADKRELKVSMLNKIAGIFNIDVNELTKPEPRKEEGVMAIKSSTCASTGRAVKVDFELKAPTAKSVALTGSFNSWDKNGVPMKRARTGLWTTDVSLKPGRYEYKFIVDGQWWTDPANSNTATNPFGSKNSIREVR